MRAALALLAVVTTMIAVAVVACGDSTPGSIPTGGTDGGGDLDAGSGPTVEKDDGQAPKDPNAPKFAPDGCRLVSTGFKEGAKAENVARTDLAGAADWTNPKGAIAIDQDFASVTLNDGQESAELRVSDFGVNVPDTATTWGVEVELKRQAPEGAVEDARVDLVIAGQVTGFKILKGPWPRTIVGTHVYGQAVDTWRIDLNPRDVNPKTFGTKLWVRKTADAGVAGPVTARVESLRVAVWYCPKK